MGQAVTVKAGITGALAILTAFWGWVGWLAAIWIACLAVDFAMGSMLALRSGAWASSKARSGIWGKLSSIIVVLVSAALDLLLWLVSTNTGIMPFQYTVILSPIVLMWYILTEMGSILENAGEMGAPLPDFLVKAIAVLHKQAGDRGDQYTDDLDR